MIRIELHERQKQRNAGCTVDNKDNVADGDLPAVADKWIVFVVGNLIIWLLERYIVINKLVVKVNI